MAAFRTHPLVAIVLLAAAIRLPLAFWPNFHHADEIFQYLEPAWRTLGHDGIVTWEWRDGMRSWLLPTLMTGPVAAGHWLAPNGMGAFVLPRLIAASTSLSIVISAWAFGARVSRTHAIVAGSVAAIWFELVYFAPHTLGEPLATAALLPAALLLTRANPQQRELMGAGALLALAVIFRFQYAPAIAVLAASACWRSWDRLVPITLGALPMLAVSAIVDIAHGQLPFAWVVANIQQNLLHDRASYFGVAPAAAYIYCFCAMWSIALVPLLLAIFQGWRHAPILVWVALVNIAFHSLIGHKEYRFVYLSVALLIIVAALGSADWIVKAQGKPVWRRLAVPLIGGGWIGFSVALAITGSMPGYWMRGIGAAQLASELRTDSQMCGLALYDAPFDSLTGRDRLAGTAPLFAFYSADPMAAGHLAAAAATASPAFNRILAPRAKEKELPSNFTPRDCASVGDAEFCVFSRNDGCTVSAASSFTINDVLARAGL